MEQTQPIDYTNLKHKILQTNEDMIKYFLQKDYKNMSLMQILLNTYIDKAIELKNKS